jgi:hypothetical protein
VGQLSESDQLAISALPATTRNSVFGAGDANVTFDSIALVVMGL